MSDLKQVNTDIAIIRQEIKYAMAEGDDNIEYLYEALDNLLEKQYKLKLGLK